MTDIMTDRNASYRELYKADIARYGVKPDFYIRTFHYLHRRASSCNFLPFKIVYKILFRLWANRRGLEISANKLMGGDSIWGMHIILRLIPMQLLDRTAISIKVLS